MSVVSTQLKLWDTKAGQEFDTALKGKDSSTHVLKRAIQAAAGVRSGLHSTAIYLELTCFYEQQQGKKACRRRQ